MPHRRAGSRESAYARAFARVLESYRADRGRRAVQSIAAASLDRLGKNGSLGNTFLNWLIDLWSLIPVRRGEGDTTALRKAIAALKKGYIFGIAPEGTRNITGKLKRAHPGTVILALHSGAPLLPIAHWGGERFLKNLARLRRTEFHIRVGEPFYLNVNGVRVTRETRQQIVDEMMVRLAALLPPEYRGEYEKVTESGEIFTKTGKMAKVDLA